jgi:hypothetical protein
MLRRIMVAGAALASALAYAQDRNDFHIQNLGNPLSADPVTAANANANFQSFAKELGAALTSTNLTPAETLGHSGFAVNAELSVVSLRGVTPTSPGVAPTTTDPSFLFPTHATFTGPMLLPSVHVRKGLPFSFEVGVRAGWIDRSSMGVATVEGKWAGNEGFAFLPDVSVRVHATRLFNTRDFDLGAGGIDFSVGKQFAIGGMISLTPYGGWDLVFVSAGTSRLVDFRPERTQQEATASQYAQLQDTGVYNTVELFENGHNRFYAGVRFVGGILQLTGEVSASGLGSIDIPNSVGGVDQRQLPPVLAVNTAIGLDF